MEGSGPRGHGVLGCWEGEGWRDLFPAKGFLGFPLEKRRWAVGGLPGQGGVGFASERTHDLTKEFEAPFGLG